MGRNKYGENTTILWSDKKRFWGMKLSFTKYTLVEKENSWVKLFVAQGFFSTHEEEVNVYRIIDSSLKRTLGNKITGVGTIHLTCKDASTPSLYLKRVKKPYKVRELITEMVERERNKKRIRVNEFHTTGGDNDSDDMDDDFM